MKPAGKTQQQIAARVTVSLLRLSSARVTADWHSLCLSLFSHTFFFVVATDSLPYILTTHRVYYHFIFKISSTKWHNTQNSLPDTIVSSSSGADFDPALDCLDWFQSVFTAVSCHSTSCFYDALLIPEAGIFSFAFTFPHSTSFTVTELHSISTHSEIQDLLHVAIHP